MSFYEIVYIVRPDASTSQVEAVTTKFTALIKEKGGEIIKSENWGLKTLAYRIKKHRKGYYTMLGVKADGKIITEVERQMRISDDIIRFLSIGTENLTAEPSIQMAPPRRREEGSSEGRPTTRPGSRPGNVRTVAPEAATE